MQAFSKVSASRWQSSKGIALLLLLLFLSPWGVEAQGGKQVLDSLQKLLSGPVKGLERGYIMVEYAEVLGDFDPEKAVAIGKDALQIGLSLKNDSLAALSYSSLGALAYHAGHFDEAFDYQRQSLHIWKSRNDSLGMARSMNNLGAMHDIIGNLDSALFHYLNALDLHKGISNDEGISATLGNIAVMYHAQGNYKEAIGYFQQTIPMDRKLGNNSGISTTYSNIGACYQSLRDFEKALEFHTEALAMRREMQNKPLISKSLNNIGLVQMELGYLGRARSSLEEAVALKREIGNSFELARSLNNLGKLYIISEKFKDALPPLREAMAIADTIKVPPLTMSTAELLSKAYAGAGAYKQAYEAEMVRKMVADSLVLREQNEQNAELMAKFDAIQREIEIDSLTHKEELREAQIESINRQTNFLIGGISIFAVLALMIFFFLLQKRESNRKLKTLNAKLGERNRQIKEQNVEIREKSEQLALKNEEILQINSNLEAIVEERTKNLLEANVELDTFLYQTSHALRAPLMRIIGLFSIAQETTDAAVGMDMYGKIDETITRMDRMLYKLLDVQEMKLRQPKPCMLDLGKLLKSILAEVAGKSDFETPEVQLDLPDGECLVADKDVLRLALFNVIENAWHFRADETGAGHRIDICIRQESDQLIATVEDNGFGIPESEQAGVFQMFHRATYKSEGTGLGLYVTQKALERIGGSIQVESKEGRYSRFVILMPLPKEIVS